MFEGGNPGRYHEKHPCFTNPSNRSSLILKSKKAFAMAKIVENKKGFKVLEVSRAELLSTLSKFGSMGICDQCGERPAIGYYVAVLNRWLCPKCYNDFILKTKWYKEDAPFEERYWKAALKLFEIEG